MAIILKTTNLSHKYSSSWAIRDIDISIEEKGIIGLLGSNGAGKSTTMNIICGVLSQTQGEVFIDGIDLRKEPEQAKKQIGFLPQNPPLYTDLTIDEFLTYSAQLRLMDKRNIKAAVDEVKERCGINHFSNRLIKNLSGGYRQRVGIAQAIVHKPNVLVLDEPTNGLDPNQIIEVRSLIKDIAKDRVVIFSSHILSEVQLLCKDIKMIENGKIVFSDTMDAFNNYVEPHSMLVSFQNMPLVAELEAIPGILKADILNGKLVRLFFSGDAEITETIISESVRSGWRLQEISLEKNSVEEIFKQLSQH